MDLTKIINETIQSSYETEPRRYIGASSIGHDCKRFIWYGLHGNHQSTPSHKTITSFNIGKRLESLPIEILKLANINIVQPNKDNSYLLFKDEDVPELQGHADGILLIQFEDPVILEIKTAKNSSFNNFKNKGLKQWSLMYYSQLQAYMGMSGYNKAVLIALNKDTSEFHHEWVDFDSKFYDELKNKAKDIASMQEPPEKINRNAMFITCNQCCYKVICHGS